jgi:hypothetical protein
MKMAQHLLVAEFRVVIFLWDFPKDILFGNSSD